MEHEFASKQEFAVKSGGEIRGAAKSCGESPQIAGRSHSNQYHVQLYSVVRE